MLNIESQVHDNRYKFFKLPLKTIILYLIVFFIIILLSFVTVHYLISIDWESTNSKNVIPHSETFDPINNFSPTNPNSPTTNPNSPTVIIENPSISEEILKKSQEKDLTIELLKKDTTDLKNKLNECEKNKNLINKIPQENNSNNNEPKIGVIIFAHKRANYLKQCLDKLFKYLPKNNKYEIFVSQDGFDKSVADVAKSFPVTLWQRDQNTLIKPQKIIGTISYYHISQHYKFGLTKMFSHPSNFDKVIILEEDIEVAPDFFEYFEATSHLLDEDKTLFCISAFNDNGMESFVSDPLALYRSDFFPGLGWMISKDLWNEIESKWPIGFWDDWLRQPENRKGRACIRPEISRSYTFGAIGVSQGQFFNQFLKRIQLSKIPINWSKLDLSYLKKKEYDEKLNKEIENAKTINLSSVDQFKGKNEKLKIYYANSAEWDSITHKLKIMTDKKDGVPRGAYKGIVIVRYQSNHLYLVPKTENILYSNKFS